MADLIVGIDLGTTNSEIAIVTDGKPRVIAIDGDPILPSMVGLAEDGKLLVGKPARNQFVLAPDRTIKSIKRQMGDDVTVQLGEQKFRPQEISAMILRRLKDAAEQDLGQPVKKAVITVPAYFNDSQRQSTREAGELAGLEVVRILNEPTAAALTYAPNPEHHERFLVYDLGGGTFDVSIVQAEGGIFEVLASHGDTKLGGDDFDDLLFELVAKDFQQSYSIDLRKDRVSSARILRAVENAKKTLSDHPFARIEEEFIAEKEGVPLHLNIEISRTEFERLIMPLVERTMECVQKSLDDAKLTAAQIKQIVLVGGSTRTPLIGELLEKRLGQPAHREVHPDLCVAMGAAIQAAIIAGETVGAVLVDITPHTLGIRCVDIPESYSMHVNEYKFAPIVHRNTPIPAIRSEAFSTVSDNQKTVEVEVYQGESSDVRRNHLVGKFLIEGLARVSAGNSIVVELRLTLDGTLQVTAREKATGLLKQITIENAMAKYAVEEREAAQERLERMWAEPHLGGSDDDADDDDEGDGDFAANLGNFLGQDDSPEPSEEAPTTAARFTMPTETKPAAEGDAETQHAEHLLDKTDRLKPKAAAEDQAELARLSESVRAALAERNWVNLKKANSELANVLFYLED